MVTQNYIKTPFYPVLNSLGGSNCSLEAETGVLFVFFVSGQRTRMFTTCYWAPNIHEALVKCIPECSQLGTAHPVHVLLVCTKCYFALKRHMKNRACRNIL